MRARTMFPFLALTLLVAAPSAGTAQDMSGTWVFAVTLDVGSGDATFVFTQEGDVLTGTYNGTLGEQTVTGTVKNGTVEFSFESQAGEITYKGTIEDGVLKGTCSYGQLGDGTFRGERRP